MRIYVHTQQQRSMHTGQKIIGNFHHTYVVIPMMRAKGSYQCHLSNGRIEVAEKGVQRLALLHLHRILNQLVVTQDGEHDCEQTN